MYTSSTTTDIDHGTTARYICDQGYGLNGGDAIRTCVEETMSEVGKWSGNAPTCDRTLILSIIVVDALPLIVTGFTYDRYCVFCSH